MREIATSSVKIVLCLFLLFLTSCASHKFSIQYPEKWKKLNTDRFLIITKEGAFQHYILVQRRGVDKPFRNTQRRIRRDMLPQEIAEVVVDEMISDRSILNFELTESLPASVNRYDGFRIAFRYESREGKTFKTIYYGFLEGEWFYNIRYNAVEDHFSEDDLEAFQQVLGSLKIIG